MTFVDMTALMEVEAWTPLVVLVVPRLTEELGDAVLTLLWVTIIGMDSFGGVGCSKANRGVGRSGVNKTVGDIIGMN